MKPVVIKNNQQKFKELSAGEISARAITILNFHHNVEAWRQNNLAVRGRKFIGRRGVGDIIGFERLTGRMVMCEVKKIGDTFKPDQIEMLSILADNGGLSLVATQEGVVVVVKKFIQ